VRTLSSSSGIYAKVMLQIPEETPHFSSDSHIASERTVPFNNEAQLLLHVIFKLMSATIRHLHVSYT